MFAWSGGAARCFQMGRRGGSKPIRLQGLFVKYGAGTAIRLFQPCIFRTARLLFGFHLSSICNHFLEKFQEAAVY